MFTYEEVKQHTPCFIVDEKLLGENLAAFSEAFQRHWSNAVLGYSCKTNSLPYILHYVMRSGGFLEVVSDTEYALAKRLGSPDSRLIFNGPTKGKERFFEALEKGAVVNLDSSRELDWLEEYDLSGHEGTVQAGLRVNFDLEAVCPEESLTNGGGNRFGYSVENGDFGRAARRIARLKHVRLGGLHMHTNSKTRSLKVFEELAKKAGELAGEYGLSLSYVDIGGSFFVRKREFDAVERYAETIGRTLSRCFDPQETALIIEPGSAVISTPVRFLTKVLDVKDTNKHRFVVTNGGRMYIDPFMRKSSYVFWIEEAGKQDQEAGKRDQENPHAFLDAADPGYASLARGRKEEQIVCGHTCMETDRLMTLSNERELAEGDFIVYDLTGGYTMSFNPLFIEYFPDVFVEREGGYELVRERWGIGEYLQKTKTGFSRENPQEEP